MTAAQDMIRGRSNIVTMTNNSGGGLVAGDVCVQDTTADENVTTTTSANSVLKVFVAAETIANGAAGKFYESGYCPLVNVNASVTRGRFLFTHTVAKQAAENATYGAGAFGKILKSGTTPSAIIYSATAQVAGGGTIGGATGAVDNAIIRADGTGGATVQSSAATIDDSGTMNIPTGQTYNINNTPHTHAGGSIGTGYIVIEHRQNNNVAGGTFTSGAWQTRPLTDEVVDTGNNVSIASNQMTLDAGTYRIRVWATCYNVLRNQMRLYNITDAAVIIVGATGYTGAQTTPNFLSGRFTLAAQKILEIQHQCQQTATTQGFGVEAGSSFTVDHETYLNAELIRE